MSSFCLNSDPKPYFYPAPPPSPPFQYLRLSKLILQGGLRLCSPGPCGCDGAVRLEPISARLTRQGPPGGSAAVKMGLGVHGHSRAPTLPQAFPDCSPRRCSSWCLSEPPRSCFLAAQNSASMAWYLCRWSTPTSFGLRRSQRFGLLPCLWC